MSFEKELLGLYLTDHPMADALNAVSKRANKKVRELDREIHLDQVFLFGGVISKIRHVQTRRSNKDMCFGTLEDQTGTARFVVFPKTYEQYRELLEREQVVLMKARVSEREGELNLIVEKVSTPKPAEIEHENGKDYHQIFIPRKTEKPTLEKLGELLKSRPGDDKVMVVIHNVGKPRRMKLPYTVECSSKKKKKVGRLLG